MSNMKNIATTFVSLGEGHAPSLGELIAARDYLTYEIMRMSKDDATRFEGHLCYNITDDYDRATRLCQGCGRTMVRGIDY